MRLRTGPYWQLDLEGKAAQLERIDSIGLT